MEKKEFEYGINDKLYIQRPLVLGQISQISKLVRGIEIPENISSHDFINLLGDRLPDALAIALSPVGVRIKDKNLDELAEEFREHMDIETAVEVVDGFFSLNPIVSAVEKLAGMMTTVKKAMTGSKGSLSSFPGETSQSETGSFGRTPQKSASPTSRKGHAGASSAKG